MRDGCCGKGKLCTMLEDRPEHRAIVSPLKLESFPRRPIVNCTSLAVSVNLAHTMASVHSIPRFLLPRGPLLLRARASPSALVPLSTLRYASSNAPPPPRPKSLAEQIRAKAIVIPKANVIPQPDKYRPPSHGKRTPRSETQQKSYGPPISAEDRERMRTKKYPNMMSPEGTFSHWFLNNRGIHIWITMVCSNLYFLPFLGQQSRAGHDANLIRVSLHPSP